MASEKGFPSKDRETERLVPQEHITAQPVREKQWAKDVLAHVSIEEIDTDAVEAGSTTSVIVATAHVAKVGDVIKFTSGALTDKEAKVIKVETDSMELGELLSEAPAASDAFTIYRHTYLETSGGALNVNAVQTPIKFRLDGAEQEVVEDTGTPANNRPLPVKLTDVTGDINITANDLNVQLDHNSANPDSVQIGDGTETLSITASGEAETSDASTHTKLDTLNAKDFATQTTLASLLSAFNAEDSASQTTLAALLTERQLKADLTETQPVSAASLPLPTGAATEATLAALAAEDFATQTTLAALLTELQLKADLTETQPVSAASLPLPTGAATEAKQDTGNTSLSNIEADIDALNARLAGNLVPETFDYIALTYVAAGNGAGEIETVTYKTGGAAGSTVATLTLAYDASDRISTVTRT
jgi:hypothetical protein